MRHILFLFTWTIFPVMADVANGDFSIIRDPEIPEKEYKIGDLVQIDIVETSESSFSESASGSKDTEWEAKISKWIRFSTKRTHKGTASDEHITTLKPAALNEPEIDVESAQNFENQSQDSRSSAFREMLTCMVKEIRPNGNVFIEGFKEHRDGDKYRKLIFSGEVSKEDLDSMDSIPSYRVFEPNIEIIEKGPHKDALKRTWLQWFIQVIWPF